MAPVKLGPSEGALVHVLTPWTILLLGVAGFLMLCFFPLLVLLEATVVERAQDACAGRQAFPPDGVQYQSALVATEFESGGAFEIST